MITGMEPARVAVVGAGPSGIFAAQAIRNWGAEVRVDIYDRLPTPYGLLRYGVAPDQTSIKGIQKALARTFEDPGVAFVGHVEFGQDLTREDLLGAYDAVIYAAGASEDRRMEIPGEQLPGSRSAREVVAWYSGHPDAEPQYFDQVRTAVTIGVGNVAVDVARILSKSTDEFRSTDMPPAVLETLERSSIQDVWIIGRRGPHHASFTTVELRKLLQTPGIQPVVHPGTLEGIDEESLDRRTRANVEAIRKAATRHVPGARTRLHLLFWHLPVAIEGAGRVERLVLEKTRLDEEGRVASTGERTVLECEAVLRAIGYRGQPLPGIPFDPARGVVPNEGGRILSEHGGFLGREYVVGWIKRGPIGVIGTNKSDANETVRHLHTALESVARTPLEEPAALWRRRGVFPTTFEDWSRIEGEERLLGASHGRDRAKIAAWAELLDIARMGRAGGPPTPADEA